MKSLLYKNMNKFNYSFKSLFAFLISFPLISSAQAGVNLSQFPLITAGGAADNLVLVPSVEWPTIDSISNLGNFNETTVYGGYFDSQKCYKYQYSATETERYFYPISVTLTMKCNYSNKEWSGNYLNWSATQTIDSFRSALTGGYRVKDTTTETWLQKARNDRSSVADRRLPSGSQNNNPLVRSLTPFNSEKQSSSSTTGTTINFITTTISDRGNEMDFTLNSGGGTVTPYDPASTTYINRTYRVSIRVKVCVPGLLEDNCKQYGSNYKPEGVIQEYSNRLRYSAFGYLNQTGTRDGAALRARQKSVGPYLANLANDEIKVDNPNKEWNADTGILYQNPNPDEANETNTTYSLTAENAIVNSGVINYINKFGSMTSATHKGNDPASEMFYAGLRYLRNKGNVPSYTDMGTVSAAQKYIYADGFPVINDWGDPYQASCQAGAFLGIGDVNTWYDKNLPGNTIYRLNEPALHPLVANDDINVITLTNKIGALEGLGSIGSQATFANSTRSNSAYIAGMAWYANAYDIRSDLAGKQTAATFWVDVVENQELQGMSANQYALAAKYGGFRVPENFDPTTRTSALEEAWWHTNNDTLTPTTGAAAFLRPDNYFKAGNSDKIVNSIKQVFARIVARVNGSGAGLSSNSTKMVTGSKVFQSVFFNKSWHGDLKAYTVDAQTGQLNPTPDWQAANGLPALTPTSTAWSNRKIYLGSNLFTWANLTAAQKTSLVSENLVNYLRGSSTDEQRNGGSFRDRFTTTLGDIVHSQPVLVGRPSASLYNGKTFSGATAYSSFANTQSTRQPILYVGANDGMLHSFNANTGAELYAYVPKTLIPELKKLASPEYQHQYFVDGELTVADAYFGGSWKTILVGTLGAGGKAVFALDITNPNLVQFLWEKNSTDIPALGNNLSKPLIAQVANGQWKAIIGNGPNSIGDKAQMLMFDLATGSVTAVDTNEGNNNGLSGITAWSTYADGISDVFYAGDVRGNVWKLKPDGSTPVKLFTAKSKNDTVQPITSGLLAGMNPENNEFWLFFGTGQYLSQTDLTNTNSQSWYGLKITSDTLIERTDLLKRRVLVETDNGTMAVRVSDTGNNSELLTKKGWYFDLPENGERMVIPNIFQGDALIGTVRIPDAADICKPTGRGFVIAINPFTGGRLDRIFFDVNGDQEFDNDDNITYQGESTAVSGVGFDSSPNSPLFIGNVMQVVQDDGKIVSMLTQGAPAHTHRTSWHEIINTP